MKKIIVQIVFIVAAVIFTQQVSAANENLPALPNPKIYPGIFTYPAKRVYEKFREITLLSTKSRINYYDKASLTKLAELKNVVEDRNLDKLESSASRLSAYMEYEKDSIIKTEDKDKLNKTINKYQAYIAYLENLRDKFEANSAQWLMISYNIDNAKGFLSEMSDASS